MKTKHTPGPWKIINYTNAGQFVTETKIVSNDDSVLAHLGPCNIDLNAKLIAAAPDLLEALKAICGHTASAYDWQRAHNAIAKAEGSAI